VACKGTVVFEVICSRSYDHIGSNADIRSSISTTKHTFLFLFLGSNFFVNLIVFVLLKMCSVSEGVDMEKQCDLLQNNINLHCLQIVLWIDLFVYYVTGCVVETRYTLFVY
jgi:hypothetical protein